MLLTSDLLCCVVPAVLLQQLAQVLSGASLALLLVRLLQCRPPSRAADRGFHGRPCSSRLTPGGASASSDGPMGVLPCPVLYPWSDGRQDLQLGLVLMLISSCSSDAESFAELGLEAASQQVGWSGGCVHGLGSGWNPALLPAPLGLVYSALHCWGSGSGSGSGACVF